MQTQLNIRNNVREMQDSVKELYAWEEEMKAKENDMQQKKHASTSKHAAPAIRGKAAPVVGTARPELLQPAAQLTPGTHLSVSSTRKTGTADSSKKRRKRRQPAGPAAAGPDTAAAHTYDYFKDKWDKFDVDAALAEADADSEYESGTSEEAPAAPADKAAGAVNVRAARPPEENAAFWKDKGNEYFKFGDHRKAKECYTSSVVAVPTAAAFANRGLTCLKLKEWEQAESDCSKALELQPEYVKAFQRRAAARAELENRHGALLDLDAALRLAPANPAMSRELRAALHRAAEAEGLQVPSELLRLEVHAPASPDAQAAPQHAPPPPAASSATLSADAVSAAPALHPGPIPERPAAADRAAPAATLASTSRAAVAQNAGGGTPVTREQAEEAHGANDVNAGLCPRGNGDAVAMASQTSGAPAFTAALASRAQSTDLRVGVPPPETRMPAAAEPVGGRCTTEQPSISPAQPSSAGPSPGPRLLSAPTTSFEFESGWRACKGDISQQASFLRLVRPDALPGIFKSSLSPGILAGVAETALRALVSDAEGAELGLQILRCMTRVERFGMNAMLISGLSKKALARAWDEVVATEHNSELSALRKLYRV